MDIFSFPFLIHGTYANLTVDHISQLFPRAYVRKQGHYLIYFTLPIMTAHVDQVTLFSVSAFVSLR